MSTLLRRGKTFYIQFYQAGVRSVKSLKTTDRVVANRKKAIFDAQGSQGSPAGGSTIMLEECLQLFLANREPTVKPGTLVTYRERVASLRSGFRNKFATDLTTDDLTDYIKTRQKAGRANKTIVEELNILKQSLKMAWQERRLPEIPIRSWPVLKTNVKDPERVGFYSQVEIDALKAHFQGHPFGHVFLFCLYTGVRRSEVRDIRMRDIRLAEGHIVCRSIKTEGHGSQLRYIPIHPELGKMLATLAGTPDAYAFPELQAHSRNWPHMMMADACKKCGITYRRFHGLRHTVATYLLAAGASLREVMDILGWTQLETAQRYIHLAKMAKTKMNLPY